MARAAFHRLFAVLLSASLLMPNPFAYAAAPPAIQAPNAMVVSATFQASQISADIMAEGGNAFDAAAATGFALAVTFPQAGNLGGGGFMVARTATGENISLDFREMAPDTAYREMFLDAQGDVIAGMSLRSPLASGTPGSVDGLLRIWEDYGSGKIGRRRLLAPAIRLASRGFIVSREMADSLNGAREDFLRDPGASKIFVRDDGRPWKAGDRLVQSDLAKTLRRIARKGREGFYAGRSAELLAGQHAASGGMITLDDLARYESKYRDVVTGTYEEYEIVSMGPPSSGGILLIQMLNMLEPYDLGNPGWGSSSYIHLLTEVQRRAYADRAEHLGDPDFWDVPTSTLISKRYALNRGADVVLDRATPSDAVLAGDTTVYESPETTHYSLVDPAGNAVAVTTTLNAYFGSKIVVDEAGFLMNNEMDDFSSKPGTPNLYGVTGGEANAIVARKRMLSSMTPTIVLRDGKPWLILGSPGGSTIITTVLQIFLNVAEHGMNIQEAVNAPRHHSQWLPDVVVREPRAIAPDVAARLEAMGHTLSTAPGAGIIGAANCILIGEEGIFGAPDPRRQSAAVGF